MRDALRTDDQESYFRILAGVDLLLPVSADVLAGLAPLGWGTWSTGGRTHVLAFTSNAALRACLADYAGSARRVPYSELANTWPNLEWWLAVNPGLPIEGYLPAWFVAQLARGDLRLPTRGPGREAHTTSKIQELGAAALAASRAGESAAGGPTYDQAPAAAAPGAPPVGAIGGAQPPVGPGGLPVRTPSGTASSGLPVRAPAATTAPATPAAYQSPVPPTPAGYQPPAPPASAGYPPPAAYEAPPAPAAYPVPPVSGAPQSPVGPGSVPPGLAPASAVPSSGIPSGRSASGSGMATPGWERPGMPFSPEEDPRGPLQDLRAPLPTRTPMANTPPVPEHVAPYDPAEAQINPSWAGNTGARPASGPPSGTLPASAPPAGAPPAGAPFSSAPPSADPFSSAPPAGAPFGGAPSSGSPIGGAALPRRQPGQSSGGGSMSSMAGFVPSSTNVSNAGRPAPAIRPASPAGGPAPASPAPGFGPTGSAGPVPGSPAPDFGSAPSVAGPVPGSPAPGFGPGSPGSGFGPGSPGSGFGPGSAGGGSVPAAGPQPVSPSVPASSAPGLGGPDLAGPGADGPGAGSPGPGGLPRRQVTPPSERPASMAAAAQALGVNRAPATEPPAPAAWDRAAPPPSTDRFGPSGPPPSIAPALPVAPSPEEHPAATTKTNLIPPVIPGAAGADRAYSAPSGSGFDRPGQGSAVPAASVGYPATAPSPIAYGLPPQGSPASAYATQTFATQALPVSTAGYTPSGASNLGVAGSSTGARGPAAAEFVPANDVERELQDAADTGNTDVFLSTLLLAKVLVPVASHSRPGSAPGESGFAFLPEEVEGERYLIVFTSKDRLSEHFGEPTRTVGVRFYELIRNWPDPAWSFAVNPGTPVGAKYPGAQIIALANWATEAGLGAEPAESPVTETPTTPVPAPEPASDEAQQATVMQKTISAEQVDYYLDRGYDRVAGFVHRASEVEHLSTPGELFGALGLYYEASPFQPDAKEAFVLRWPAYRPSLYRIPYGGQNEQALRAMDGWVIERPPFRGNGFAPGEGRDVIAEFKVDSVRLPHGAQLWRVDADGNERMIAIFDMDGPLWRRVGEQ